MKKLIAITMAAVLGLSILSGCAPAEQNPITASDYAASLSEFLVSGDFGIDKPLEPVESTGSNASLGKNIANAYKLGDGINVYTYESPEDKSLLEVLVSIDFTMASDITIGGAACGHLVQYFDKAERKRISDELDINNIVERRVAESNGDFGAYQYTIDPGNKMFLSFIPTPSQTPEVVETTPPPEPTSAVATFGRTTAEMVAIFSDALDSSGATNVFSETPSIEVSEGGVTTSEYAICPGASIIFYEDNSLKSVTSMAVSADKSVVSSADLSGPVADYLAHSVAVFVTTKEEFYSTADELNLGNTTDNATTMALDGEYCDFVYLVDGNTIMLLVSPVALSTEKNTQQTEVDLSALSAAIVEEFSGAFGYPGNETSWYKYVQSITVTEVDGIYSAVVIVSTTDAEPVDRIGNAVYANYCLNDFEGIDIDSCFVFDEEMNTLFIRADEV